MGTLVHRWPVKWHYVLLLALTSAFFIALISFTDEIPWILNVILLLLALPLLVGTFACLVITTLSIDNNGNITVQHKFLIFKLFYKSFPVDSILRWELRTIPLQVAPGRLPRSTYALVLVHRDGEQPIHQEDNIELIEPVATRFAEASGIPLVKIVVV